MNHLWAILQEAWGNISSQCLSKPRLSRAVIAANGGYFDESFFFSSMYTVYVIKYVFVVCVVPYQCKIFTN